MTIAMTNHDPMSMFWEYVGRFPFYHFVSNHWVWFVAPVAFLIGWAFAKFFMELLSKRREGIAQ